MILQRHGMNRNKIEHAARLGWAARGALYFTLGSLAILAAVGEGGGLHGSDGVIQWVFSLPMGQVLVGISAVGFAAYAVYRLLTAVTGHDDADSKLKDIVARIEDVVTGLGYGSLAVAAVQLLFGESGGSGNGKQYWIAQALQQPFGPALIGTIGVIVMGFGLFQFKRAVTDSHADHVRSHEMSQREKNMFVWVGRIGYSARGVVLLVIGYFTLRAATNASPNESKGVGGALQEIGEAGVLPLAIIAAGLVAYGVLQLFYARYRRVDVKSPQGDSRSAPGTTPQVKRGAASV